MDWLTLIIYVILILIVIYVINSELKDIQCQDSKGTICGPLTGRAYSLGKPAVEDDYNTLLDKIIITSRYEMNSIHWRRSFIVAAIAAFIVLYVMKNRLPDGISLLIAFLIIYILVYISYIFFQKAVTYPALKQMKDIVQQLQEI